MPASYTPRQAALWFARNSHPILPLHSVEDGRCTCRDPACTSAGKHPHAGYAPHGAKDATADADTIKAWFAESYWLNYGVACERLFVVDVDVKHDGLETWRAMHCQPTRALPHTWQVRTGSGGLHVFFTPPAKVRNGDLDKGIQLKAAGGYVVGVGSKHKSGDVYDWLPQCSPKDAPLGTVPPWLLTMMETRCYLGTVTPPEEWRRLAGATLHDGERHTTLCCLAVVT
jgi:Bifunctional DNA primase/polymerase, N-terminal